jgi:hypothetical protein
MHQVGNHLEHIDCRLLEKNVKLVKRQRDSALASPLQRTAHLANDGSFAARFLLESHHPCYLLSAIDVSGRLVQEMKI